ncbi:MAG: response regulator [Candidatus Odinarchaeota archaeon]
MATIMIVDDDEDIVYLFEQFLEETGHEAVAKAYSGEQALDIYSKLFNEHQHLPELVLIDYRMPGMDGLKLMDKILAINPSCKVIIVSADFTIKEKAVEKGAILFIEKPITVFEEFERAIEKCVNT